MNKLIKVALLFVIPATISFAKPEVANAQIEVQVYPPAAYIATAQPEYFEGRPAYFYNNYWYYRDHGRWSYYRSEPGYLRDRRAHWGHDRYVGYRGRERVVDRGRYRYRR